MNAGAVSAAEAMPSGRSGGVLILGGAHGALALARGVGRQGGPGWLGTEDHPLPALSRFVTRSLRWPGPHDPGAVDWLLRLADERGLDGYQLVPAGDAEVRLVAEALDRLRGRYSIDLPPWPTLSVLCDKAE